MGAGTWRILATDVDDAVIRRPPGISGTIDLEVELRLANDVMVDHGSLHCELQQKPTVSAAPIDEPTHLIVCCKQIIADGAFQPYRKKGIAGRAGQPLAARFRVRANQLSARPG